MKTLQFLKAFFEEFLKHSKVVLVKNYCAKHYIGIFLYGNVAIMLLVPLLKMPSALLIPPAIFLAFVFICMGKLNNDWFIKIFAYLVGSLYVVIFLTEVSRFFG